VFFAADGWADTFDPITNAKQNRKVVAVYTITRGKECAYGLVEAKQNYIFVSDSFGPTIVSLQKEFPVDCAQTR
jgi:hypothetical protein